jgi:hypothetical protein
MPFVKVEEKIIEFKPLRSIEECRAIKQGEMIGIGELITDTIPARCMSNNGKIIRLIGNMDNKVMMECNFEINKITGFYEDGSIIVRMDVQEPIYIEKEDTKFNDYQKFWGGLQK